MPSRTLPSLFPAEIAEHNSAKSCYVTIGANVYDITDFVDDHPGGGNLVLEYGGKDVTEILKDEVSHTHSDSAYEILEDNLIGFVATGDMKSMKSKPPTSEPLTNGVSEGDESKPLYQATGMSCEEDLSRETDIEKDYKRFKFLDLDKPLLMQVWFGNFEKEFYLEQIHRPRHYKGGASAPLFGNFLEPLSKTPWWVVPLIWLPPVAYGTFVSRDGLSSWGHVAAYCCFGIFLWTLVEYVLHRFLFHLDGFLPNNRVALTMHFLLHGIHHYLPMDKLRLVMPPTLFIVLATPFYHLAHYVFAYNPCAAQAVFCGGIFGYICYDMTHYFLHHAKLPEIYKETKKWHLEHHYKDYENGFGVTSRFWDVVFRTELMVGPAPSKKTL